MALVGLHVYISGRVQGVNYRYSTVIQAKKFGLKGWVRNMYDGRVEALFEGEEEIVDRMLSWCHQGPPMSYVTKVETFKREYSNEFDDFTVTG